jgi:hypothetical protein
MALKDDFYSLKALEDRSVWLTMLVGTLTAASAVLGLILSLNAGKLSIDRVADVSFVPKSTKTAEATVPVSELASITKNPRNVVWSGYVADVFEVCQNYGKISEAVEPATAEGRTVFLVKEGENLAAATVKSTADVCSYFRKKGTKNEAFVASDVPFSKIESEKKFIALDNNIWSKGGS